MSNVDWSMFETDEAFERTMADIRRKDEEHLQERVLRGLQPERPPHFVDREISVVLNKRLEHVLAYLVEFAVVLSKAGRYVPSPHEVILKQYRSHIILLSESIEAYHEITGFTIKSMVHTLIELEEGRITPSRAARSLLSDVHCMDLRDLNLYKQELPPIDEERLKHLQNDEEYLTEEIERYMAQYNELEEEIDDKFPI